MHRPVRAAITRQGRIALILAYIADRRVRALKAPAACTKFGVKSAFDLRRRDVPRAGRRWYRYR
jgi:hypothetical protein